jgi:hypothetical protein
MRDFKKREKCVGIVFLLIFLKIQILIEILKWNILYLIFIKIYKSKIKSVRVLLLFFFLINILFLIRSESIK